LKVVYHLNDLDKVSFALGNIQNHFDGVGGPDHVTIALVVHGQALRAFHSATASPDLSKRVGQFSKAGLELAVCGNTMKSQNITLKDLLPGFIVAERAAWCGSPSCNSRAMFTCGPEALRFQILPIDANLSRRSLIWAIWAQ
jgi:intracellular sulfur oxidation DsrE/DsrF family protein